MKAFSIISLFQLFVVACSQNGNPVHFSNISPPVFESTSTMDSENENSQIITPPRHYTLLELYLAEIVDREYVMKWFFDDMRQYKPKIYDIKQEIASKQPLNDHDIDRILLLEAGMNDIIRTFNNRNILLRSKDFVIAGYNSRNQDKNQPKESHSVKTLEEKGMPATAISDNPLGYIGSMTQRGFQIQYVDFLDRKSTK